MNYIRTLPIPVLSIVLTYEIPTFKRISVLIRVLLGSTPSVEDNDYIYETLIKKSWRSVSSDDNSFEKKWRPNLNSWTSLYRVLETWIPREGFYSVLDAAPWGLLLRIRFKNGTIIGELVYPNEEKKDSDNAFIITPVLTIEFGDDAQPSKVILCNEEIKNPKIVFGYSNTLSAPPTIEPSLTSCERAPSNVASSRAITIIEGDDTYTPCSKDWGNVCESKWHPDGKNVPPEELIQSLFINNFKKGKRSLTVDWIDGPTREETFDYEEGMPIIKPGLYSGVYHEMYGKFKREIILVQYKTYTTINHEVKQNQKPTPMNTIKKEAFNHPTHKDKSFIFQQLSEQIKITKQESIVVVLGRKVTGDIHVPMRQLTFGAIVHPSLNLAACVGDDCPSKVRDRGSGREEYSVVRHWDGWGTLAFPFFNDPGWAPGALLQVVSLEKDRNDKKEMEKGNHHRFGFLWKGDNDEVSILKRMTEQDLFQWFR